MLASARRANVEQQRVTENDLNVTSHECIMNKTNQQDMFSCYQQTRWTPSPPVWTWTILGPETLNYIIITTTTKTKKSDVSGEHHTSVCCWRLVGPKHLFYEATTCLSGCWPLLSEGSLLTHWWPTGGATEVWMRGVLSVGVWRCTLPYCGIDTGGFLIWD